MWSWIAWRVWTGLHFLFSVFACGKHGCPVATKDMFQKLNIWLFIFPNESVNLSTDRRHAHFNLKCSWIREQSKLSAEVKEKCLHSIQHLNDNFPLVLFPPLLYLVFLSASIIFYSTNCLCFFLCQHKQCKKHWLENCEAYHFTEKPINSENNATLDGF